MFNDNLKLPGSSVLALGRVPRKSRQIYPFKAQLRFYRVKCDRDGNGAKQ